MGIFAQTAGAGKATQAPNPKDAPSATEDHDAKSGLDKEYYDYYFKTLPEYKNKDKAKLNFNLIRHLKKEILSQDFSKPTQEAVSKISPDNVQFERVNSDSIWVRGIKSQKPYIKYREYMYVVKHEKYFCFMTFEINPEDYLQQARQVELIQDLDDKFKITVPKP